MSRIGSSQPVADTQALDAANIEGIQAGDREALGALYDRHAGLLTALGLRIIADLEIVSDILHDVFIEVWEKASTYDEARARVRTWLALRMRSRCLDRLRSAAHKRRTQVSEERFERVVQSDAERRGNDAHDPVDRERAVKAIAHLSPEQRSVIECLFFQGLTSSEAAIALNLSIGTVKSRVRLAMARLRDALGVSGDV